MNDNQATLETFFKFTQAAVPGSEEFEKLEADQLTARIEDAIKNSKKNFSVPIVAGALLGPIAALLNIPLQDIIVRAWNEGGLFEKYLDPEKYDPDESISIVLKNHEVTSSHAPAIDVELNEKKIGSIDFQLDLTLTFEGAILQIRGGRIIEIQAGRIKGAGTLMCESFILVKRETETMDLPGTIKFSEQDSAEQ
jgi:hypothetical protein